MRQAFKIISDNTLESHNMRKSQFQTWLRSTQNNNFNGLHSLKYQQPVSTLVTGDRQIHWYVI